MEKGEIQTELADLTELKRQFDEEMVYALETGDTTKALGLKDEIERRINLVQEILTPPGTFNKEQREALENKGFVIYRLTGESIKSLEEQGYKYQSTSHKKFPDLEELCSRKTEVAFNPDPGRLIIISGRFFLPDSGNKTFEEQKEMVEKYSSQLQQEIKGVKAVIGQAPDYAELAFKYKGEYGLLFGIRYHHRSTRTSTEVGLTVANVGLYACAPGSSFPSLDIYGMGADACDRRLWVAPLVVPDYS